MVSVKNDIKFLIDELPENASYDDVIKAIYVRQKIIRGIKDSEGRNNFSQEEAKAQLRKWLK